MPEACKICNGDGLIQVDDLNTRLCICAYARRMFDHLGPEISRAVTLKESPLYIRNADGTPGIDRTNENVFIRASWPELLPHLKFALCFKGLNFRCRVTTDENLRSIWLGHESYKAKSSRKRDDLVTYNSLAEFMLEHHLVVIRLGYLGYKNIAMPGILKEALMHREVARKPTWIVEDPDRLYQDGNFSYSYEVEAYIATHFKTNLNLVGDTPLAPIEKTWTDPTLGPPEMASPGISVEDVIEEEVPQKKPYKPKSGGVKNNWKQVQKEAGRMDKDFGGDK